MESMGVSIRGTISLQEVAGSEDNPGPLAEMVVLKREAGAESKAGIDKQRVAA